MTLSNQIKIVKTTKKEKLFVVISFFILLTTIYDVLTINESEYKWYIEKEYGIEVDILKFEREYFSEVLPTVYVDLRTEDVVFEGVIGGGLRQVPTEDSYLKEKTSQDVAKEFEKYIEQVNTYNFDTYGLTINHAIIPLTSDSVSMNLIYSGVISLIDTPEEVMSDLYNLSKLIKDTNLPISYISVASTESGHIYLHNFHQITTLDVFKDDMKKLLELQIETQGKEGVFELVKRG